jgi:DNA-binding transcriptional MerR regulator
MRIGCEWVSGRTQLGTAVSRKPKKFWKVGDLVRHTGLSRQTLHNWVQLGLITEATQTESGHRLYDDSVFERLERIQRWKAKGKGLREIAELLSKTRRRASTEGNRSGTE